MTANPENQNILSALGLINDQPTGVLPPEILEYLRNLGTEGATGKGQAGLRQAVQPVGPEAYQYIHPLQVAGGLLDSFNRRRALDSPVACRAGRGTCRSRSRTGRGSQDP